jgi:hypothetical protein
LYDMYIVALICVNLGGIDDFGCLLLWSLCTFVLWKIAYSSRSEGFPLLSSDLLELSILTWFLAIAYK